jgi:hypothetical protein
MIHEDGVQYIVDTLQQNQVTFSPFHPVIY